MAFTSDQLNHIKLLLDVQAKGYNDAIDRVYNEMNNIKKQYDVKIHDLEVSLEYSYKTIDELKRSVIEKEAFIKQEKYTNSEIHNIKLKLNRQEDYSRKHNIRIEGIDESRDETSEQTQIKVRNIFQQYFNNQEIGIDLAHRIKSPNRNHGPRTILTKLSKRSDRDVILRNTSKLKNSKIYIYEDLSEGTMQIRKSQIPEMKAARESGKIAYFVGDKLVIRDRNPIIAKNANPQSTTPPRSVTSLVNVFSTPQTLNSDPNNIPSPLLQNMSNNRENSTSNSVNESQKGNVPRRSARTNNT